jgi:hypothetical protein
MIGIGVLDDHSPQKVEMQKDNYGWMMVIPPRLNGLRLKQPIIQRIYGGF